MGVGGAVFTTLLFFYLFVSFRAFTVDVTLTSSRSACVKRMLIIGNATSEMQKMLKLERFVSPGKGNGVRANVALRRGQLVLSAEPLACCVSNRVRSQVCHHCFSW